MAKEKIKEIGYNLVGSDLENFIKVRDDLLIGISSLEGQLNFYEKTLKNMEDERDFWLEIEKTKNDKFNYIKDKLPEILKKSEEQIPDCKKKVILLTDKLYKIKNLYNTRFTNLPIENGVCVVDDETRIYANIEAQTVVDME